MLAPNTIKAAHPVIKSLTYQEFTCSSYLVEASGHTFKIVPLGYRRILENLDESISCSIYPI